MSDSLYDFKKKFDPIGYQTADRLFGAIDKPEQQLRLDINKSQDIVAPAAPLPPATDPNAAAATNAALEDERRRRALAGRANTNPTGGLGLTGSSGAVSKSLLGM